jgi:4-hydroxy-tetrahydrodipicolinate synthase
MRKNTEEKKLKGVVAPCITPFRPDGEVDEPALRSYIDFLAGKVHGISVCAIYGSGILMRVDQRQRVAEIIKEVAGGRSAISVFVGAADTDTSVKLARHAQEIGVQAISCVAPFYYRQVDEAIYRHYMALIETTDLSVYAYDSTYSGNPISLDLLERLADAGLAGVITGAITYGIEHLYAVRRRLNRPDFDVWSIRDGLALPAMLDGAVGFESGVANFFPEVAMALYQAISQKDYEHAAVLQQRVLRLRDVSHSLGKNIPTLHAMISIRGLETGVPRRPFFLLSDVELADLKTGLAKLDFSTPLNL